SIYDVRPAAAQTRPAGFLVRPQSAAARKWSDTVRSQSRQLADRRRLVYGNARHRLRCAAEYALHSSNAESAPWWLTWRVRRVGLDWDRADQRHRAARS